MDPVRGLEAYADGFDVLPALGAAQVGEIFITATGSRDVLAVPHFERMRDGAIVANAGGVDVEIDVEAARIKLDAVGMGVDALTPEQERFLVSWRE